MRVFKNSRNYYLATADGDQPRVRPFGTAHIFENKLYIQSGHSKDVAKQMLKNPKIEISACLDDRWIRIAATAVLDERTEAQESLLAAYPSLQEMYKPGDGNVTVFYLQDAKATISSFTGGTESFTF